MSPQTLAKLLTIGLIGLIFAVAGDDSNYSYWKPENSANYDVIILNKNNYKLKSLYKPDVVLTQIGSGELNLNNYRLSLCS